MKLDTTDLRYITSDEFRALTAVEMGSKNHEVVPTPLIAQISGLRNGGVNKLLGSLAKRNLIARVQNSKYDGYRLTYGGYDYLAMRTFSKRGSVHSVGNQIGVGKESDIYVVADEEGKQMVLKLHRLGRVSFRAIKSKRDYMGTRKHASWMYMSRLAAQKEWAFMKVLHEHGFPVPKPIDQARHCIVMELIDSFPLRQVADVPSPGALYSTLMDLIVRFAKAGLIHGDFNEFNILIRQESGEPIIIDFPQMVSTRHENAEYYFNRDVDCIRTFFKRRFGYESKLYPRFTSTMKEGMAEADSEEFRLDVVVSASGFKYHDMKTLEEYMNNSERQEEEDSEETEEEESGDEEPPRDGEPVGNEPTPPTHEKPFSRSRAPSPSPSLVTQQMQALDIKSDLPSPSEPVPPNDALEAGDTPSEEELDDDGDQDNEATPQKSVLKQVIASEVAKHRQRQKSKFHSKSGGAGRAKGSKAKQDTRVKLGKGDMWD